MPLLLLLGWPLLLRLLLRGWRQPAGGVTWHLQDARRRRGTSVGRLAVPPGLLPLLLRLLLAVLQRRPPQRTVRLLLPLLRLALLLLLLRARQRGLPLLLRPLLSLLRTPLLLRRPWLRCTRLCERWLRVARRRLWPRCCLQG